MNALNQYRSYQEETASREDVVVMLYDGARRFTDLALAALRAQDYEKVSLNTGKAQRILEELQGMLNMEVGGVVAKNLWQLYDYWQWRLGRGLVNKDESAFAEVSAVLADMREAWADAARQVKATRGVRTIG